MDETNKGQQVQTTSPLVDDEDYNTIPECLGGTWEAFFEMRKRYNDNYTRLLPELAAYQGLHVCISPDGTRVLDSDADWSVLWQRLANRGLRPRLLGVQYVDRLDEVYFSGFIEEVQPIVDEQNQPGHDILAPIDEDRDPIPACWGGTWEAYVEMRKQYYGNFNKLWPTLEAYRGQHVAFTPDATQILDSDLDGIVLRQRLKEQWPKPHLLPLEYIPRVEEEGQI